MVTFEDFSRDLLTYTLVVIDDNGAELEYETSPYVPMQCALQDALMDLTDARNSDWINRYETTGTTKPRVWYLSARFLGDEVLRFYQ